MNQKHIQSMQAGINLGLGKRKIRVKQTIGISQNQLGLTRRILKIREKINSISNEQAVAVYMDDVHTGYLFRFTRIGEKNLVGFIDKVENKCIYDVHGDHRIYSVFSPENFDWSQVDCVIVADLNLDETERKKELEIPETVEVINLYDEEDLIPFWAVPVSLPQQIESPSGELAGAVLEKCCELPEEYLFGMIEKIDKINNILETCGEGRICVYCVGEHTKYLFEYTDIKYKNVVAFADRKVKKFCGLPVRENTAENFKDIDYIVISSFLYQEEIESYLIDIGLQDKIVKLYDMTDEVPFYETANVCSPDRLVTFLQSENGLSMADLYACVEWSSGSLSENSDYLVTYNLLKNRIIDKGILHNRSENEIAAEKNYDRANSRAAVVLQGPIVYEDDFTYRTLCYYSILWPKAKIILSTWMSEKERAEFQRFYELPVEVVLSDPPAQKGVLNINYQVKSTYAGIVRAKELGCEYVIKTRTDFRLYADDCISYLYTLTEMFADEKNPHKRLAILPPYLDMAYYIPDYIISGSVKDMLQFWNEDEVFPDHTDGLNPEMLLFSRYIKYLGSYIEEPLNQLKDYIDMLCREFIVTDPAVYKWYWKKYSYEGSILYQESKNILTAADWFYRQLIFKTGR